MVKFPRRLVVALAMLALAACTQPAPLAPSGPLAQPTPLSDREVLALVESDQFDTLDRHFSALQNGYKNGSVGDVELRAAFRAFYATDPALERHYTAWVDHYPRSYVARLARGSYFKKVGLEARGSKPFAETTDAQLQRM